MTTNLPRHYVAICAIALIESLCANTASAAPTYFVASDVLPAGLPTLLAERSVFHDAVSFPLMQEGFEQFSSGDPIDFGLFTLDLIAGNGFYHSSGNELATTEGNSTVFFQTQSSTAVDFLFDTPINALGIDITGVDFTSSHVSFIDSNGNVLSDFAMQQFAGATFFGTLSAQSFSTARFEFTGSEYITFDYLEFGAVPEPSSCALLGFALVGLVALRSRQRRQFVIGLQFAIARLRRDLPYVVKLLALP